VKELLSGPSRDDRGGPLTVQHAGAGRAMVEEAARGARRAATHSSDGGYDALTTAFDDLLMAGADVDATAAALLVVDGECAKVFRAHG
jgi:hypothetical protein